MTGKPTFDQWRKVGETLGRCEQSVMWWLGDWINYGEHEYGEKYAQALSETDFEYGTIKDAAYVSANVQLSCRHDNLTFEHHRAVAPLAPPEQKRWLAKAAAEHWSRQELRQAIAKERLETVGNCPLPTGRYDVIVCDPPWPIEKIPRDVRPKQIGMDYPIMTAEAILSFTKVTDKAAENCHLFLWTTHRFLPLAIQCCEAWGFVYSCCLVWHKPGGFQPVGMPQLNCEFVLYARRGTPVFVDTKKFPVCFEAARGKHSEKPGAFYDLIRRVTAGRRLDMFARRKIEGFCAWGSEFPKNCLHDKA